MPVDQRLAGLPAAGLDVADGDALHVGEGEHALEVVGAARADPDDAERDLLAGRRGAPAPQGPGGDDPGKRGCCARREGLLQQVASRLAWPLIPIRLHGEGLLNVPVDRSSFEDRTATVGVQGPAIPGGPFVAFPREDPIIVIEVDPSLRGMPTVMSEEAQRSPGVRLLLGRDRPLVLGRVGE